MEKSVITVIARKKLAQARKGEINLPVVTGIALGDGAEHDGEVQIPKEEDNALKNELIRKPYVSCVKLTDTSYRYRIDLSNDELADKVINEAALYDADGDLLAINAFIGKPKEGHGNGV